MPAKRLKGDGTLADEIVDVLFEGRSPGDMMKIAKSLLDNTLNHPNVDPYLQAEMVAAICFEQGLNPPDWIKKFLL